MNRSLLSLLLAATLATPALAAGVKVEKPRVRATAPGQEVAEAFMDLTATTDMTLVGGSSPVAKSFELHFMKMENGVMEMRPVKTIALPRGKTVSLESGGLHIMLVGLKGRIKPGQKVPLTLLLKGGDGREEKLAVIAEARR